MNKRVALFACKHGRSGKENCVLCTHEKTDPELRAYFSVLKGITENTEDWKMIKQYIEERALELERISFFKNR